MGLTVSLKCDKCGYNITLQTGAGIRDHDINRVLAFFSEKNQMIIRKVLKIDQTTGDETPVGRRAVWNFGRRLAVDGENGEIKAIPVFSVKEDGTERIVAAECESRDALRFLSPDELKDSGSDPVCPKCGGKMIYEEVGLWD